MSLAGRKGKTGKATGERDRISSKIGSSGVYQVYI